MKRSALRYVLSIGDLSINELLQIGEACHKDPELGKNAKRKVHAAVEQAWGTTYAVRRLETLWGERCAAIDKKRDDKRSLKKG